MQQEDWLLKQPEMENLMNYKNLKMTCLNNGNNTKNTDKPEETMKEETALIDREEALKIAKENAQRIYRDLSIYKIKAELKDEKWYVDYVISDPQMVGGGPHYVISAKTGEIISYRYEQ